MNGNSDSFPYAEDGVVENDFTQQFRYPIVSHPWPRWNYITMVVVDDSDPRFRYSIRPTDEELAIVGSFHEYYCDYWYGNNTFRQKMRARPFDIDGGANGRLLIKYPNGGWAYGRRSWEYGPTFVPERKDAPMDLVAVLDREQTIVDEVHERWIKWKRDRPEIFEKGDAAS